MMMMFADVAVGLVALLHLYFLVLEMFLCDTPFGRRTFGVTREFAAASKSLAANQGLYNSFLACVILAGVFGAITVNRRILGVQALPAVMALLLMLLARG